MTLFLLIKPEAEGGKADAFGAQVEAVLSMDLTPWDEMRTRII